VTVAAEAGPAAIEPPPEAREQATPDVTTVATAETPVAPAPDAGPDATDEATVPDVADTSESPAVATPSAAMTPPPIVGAAIKPTPAPSRPAMVVPATTGVTQPVQAATTASTEPTTPVDATPPAPEKDVAPVPTEAITNGTTPGPPAPKEPATRPALAARASVGDLDISGSLPRSSVQRALDGARSAIEACYRQGAEAAGRDVAGNLAVAFAIDIDGQIRDVVVAPFDLPGVSACAAGTLARLRTRDRPDTGTVSVRARLRLSPLPPLPAP
jgi:hypothetical protein